ncbi:MAG: hypothetical protein JWR27_2247 [Aeromicrobium sp.]|nr:hypothetical protein [Aeromicrobium sp.]
MGQYQIRDTSDGVIAEESFGDFEEANTWALEQDAAAGWTLFQQIGGDWVPARHDPTPAG